MTELPQRFSLEQRRVLVTGATGYLGQAMARGLAELGATVLVHGRDAQRVEETVDSLRDMGFDALPAIFDLNDDQAVRDWFARYGEGALHGLVNNAYAGGAGAIETATEDDYRNSYEVSLVAAHRLLQQALPFLRTAVRECGGGVGCKYRINVRHGQPRSESLSRQGRCQSAILRRCKGGAVAMDPLCGL